MHKSLIDYLCSFPLTTEQHTLLRSRCQILRWLSTLHRWKHKSETIHKLNYTSHKVSRLTYNKYNKI